MCHDPTPQPPHVQGASAAPSQRLVASPSAGGAEDTESGAGAPTISAIAPRNVDSDRASGAAVPTTVPIEPPNGERRTGHRDAKGKFQPGNGIGVSTRFTPSTAATQLTHGARRYERTGALPEALKAQQADDYAGLVADLGGDLSTAKQALVEKAIEVLTLTRLYSADLARRGPFTDKGRVRATTVGYLAAVDRLVRLFAILGIERKPKDAVTLERYLAEKYSTSQVATASADASEDSGA